MSRSRRIVTCTFCGLRGPRSREDAFPHWLIKAIGGNVDVLAMSQFTGTAGDCDLVDRRAFGSAAVYKLRAVCATCNNEWLKKLEEAASPLLTPLLNGERVAMDVKAGDKVLFGKYAGTEVKLDGEEYLILREDDVLGVIEGATKAKGAK